MTDLVLVASMVVGVLACEPPAKQPAEGWHWRLASAEAQSTGKMPVPPDGASSGVELVRSPDSVPCFDVAEFAVKVSGKRFKNPFTEADLSGTFTPPAGAGIAVVGFADADDGSMFRLRFSPQRPGLYPYELRFQGEGIDSRFRGTLVCEASDWPGPVIVDPKHPKHFAYARSRRSFFHLGYTAYHLLDPSNTLADVDATIDYAARRGFNKVRFLLAGYPRDFDRRTSQDVEHGVPDPWKAPNYGARPGQVNPLPAWPGKPHAYDFTRFYLPHWQRVDHAVRRMRQRGIVATCIFTIEKQDLPREYGRLSEHEYRFYRYAMARLGAFCNVWWDLGNEHNEYRDRAWGDAMGGFVKRQDPHHRLASAHAYAEFFYEKSPWADFIITQQYGDERTVHDWAMKFRTTPKPYVNEEYGYEGSRDVPGHGQNADWVRRCHWAIAMAGGYATYGDWTGGVAYFYMGEPGPGKAADQLGHLRSFFEPLGFATLEPHDELTTAGFCLARPPEVYAVYLPRGGKADLRLDAPGGPGRRAQWFDPRTGRWADGPTLTGGVNPVSAPGSLDWVLLVSPR